MFRELIKFMKNNKNSIEEWNKMEDHVQEENT